MCLNCGATSSRKDSYLKHRTHFHTPPSPDKGFSMIEMNASNNTINISNGTVPKAYMKDEKCMTEKMIDFDEQANEYAVPY